MEKKILVVGAGITGATIAVLLSRAGYQVTVIEKTNFVGGACSDTYENFAYKQNHGSHIFHTNNAGVASIIEAFTEIRPYTHKVKGLINGELVPIPINVNSLDALFVFSSKMKSRLLDFLTLSKEYTFEELSSISKETREFADVIYDNVFKFYSYKQWGQKPDISVLSRVKAFRYSKDDRYFLDKFQGIPKEGFTSMIRKMLYDNDLIKVVFNCQASVDMFEEYDTVFYTGTIDELFDFKFGKLPYRTCKFTYEYARCHKPQEAAVINYTQNYNFTRSHDFSWYIPTGSSIIAYEYPKQHESEDEPRYYPIKDKKNLALYEKYKKLLEEDYPNVVPAGRLGTYQYLNIDQAMEQAMTLVWNFIDNELENEKC